MLISFNSSNKLLTFLGTKDSLKEFFSDVSAWNNWIASSRRLVWINVLGIPFNLRNLDFMKVIGDECGEFITVSKFTLNKRRLDVAFIFVPSSLNVILSSLH